jgi:hypothetical protein
MTLTADNFDLLKSVNDCQISDLKRIQFDRSNCMEFYRRVRNVEAAVIHTYQLTAHAALREDDAGKASCFWKDMVTFCDSVLVLLKELKEKYPDCGASEVYNVTLDYRVQAQNHYIENLQDSECQTIPEGLFPQVN